MSTWTFKAFAPAVLLFLAACEGGFGVSRNAPSQISLPDGTIVAGADGWCVDEATTRADRDTAVVVFGSCAALARNALAPQPDLPGVVTVSIDGVRGAAPTPEEFAAYFASEPGRAALARDGQAESVEIIDVTSETDVLYLGASDRSASSLASPVTWRALFEMGGRIVSVSLYGLPNEPIERSEGLRTLEAQIDRLMSANGAS